MTSLNQNEKIYYRNQLVSFIDWDSELEGYLQVRIGTAFLIVKREELKN